MVGYSCRRTRPEKAAEKHLDNDSKIARDDQKSLIGISRTKAVGTKHTDNALQLLMGLVFHADSYLDCILRIKQRYANASVRRSDVEAM